MSKLQYIFLILILFFSGCASNKNQDSFDSLKASQAEMAIPFDRHLCSYNSPISSTSANAGHIKTCKHKNKNCYQAALFSERTGHFSEAQQFYKKACDQKNLDSCYCLAQSMMTEKKSNSEIAEVFTNSCKSGHQDSCSFINNSLYTMHKDEKAFDSLQKDCAKGSVRACYFTAIIHQQQGDLNAAEKLLKSTCSKKYPLACNDLALLYQSKEDSINSAIYTKKACMLGVAESCLWLTIFDGNWIQPHVQFCKKGFLESCMIVMKSKNNSVVKAARKSVCSFDTVICNRNDEYSKEEFSKKYDLLKKNSLSCVTDSSVTVSFKSKPQSFEITRCVK